MTGRGWSVHAWRAWSQAFASAQDGHVAHHGTEEGLLRHLSSDTRTLTHPDESIFFALVGPWHDGHDHIAEAHTAGVRRWVVSKPPRKSDAWAQDSDVLVVPDVMAALQHAARTQRDAFVGPVLAITGSNGKTTVKEWVASLLPERIAIHRSPLSHNSQLGVPLSVWSLEQHHDLSLIEAGISHPGEMERLRDCIVPTEGVLTHLGEAHLGNFKGPDHLTREKCALFKHCVRVFLPEALRLRCQPHLSKETVTWAHAQEAGAKHATLQVEVDTSRRHLTLHWRGASATMALPFTSDASVHNACTAALVALHHGATLEDIQHKLPSLTEPTGRLSSIKRPRGGILIQDDCNHDLGSLEVALRALDQAPDAGQRVAIVGDVPQSGLTVEARIARMVSLLAAVRLDALWFWAPAWSDAERHALVAALHERGVEAHGLHDLSALVELAQTLDRANVLIKVSSNDQLHAVIHALAPPRHITTLTMNMGNLVHNIRVLKAHVGASGVIAVIKGLGYGTDPVMLGRLLEAQGVDWLAVAYADEGVALREAGVQAPILVLNPDPATFGTMHRHELEPQLVSLTHIRVAREWAETHGVEGWPVHLKLDTGMHRLGLASTEDEEAEALLAAPELTLASVMSHLAGADEPTLDDETRRQMDAFFQRTSQRFAGVPRHILNSAGAARIWNVLDTAQRQTWAPLLTHIRVGLAMYGLGPGADTLGLEPVLSLHTSVAKLVDVPAGEGSGYGLTDAASHHRTLAVLSVGYADGYPRALGNGVGHVGWKGQLLPTVGRVCMDMVTVDATGLDISPGDRVALWGDAPRLEKVAAEAGTIPYELLTRIGPRVQRVIER